jgi:hypothetical protein
MQIQKKRVSLSFTINEYDTIFSKSVSSNETINAYCKNKILNQNESELLKTHIIRQFEDLLYLLISQNSINKETINQEKIKEITSLAIYVGNLKAITNKKLKFQRQIEKDYDALFKLVNIPTINRLIKNVNEQKDNYHKKISLLASYITRIKSILK